MKDKKEVVDLEGEEWKSVGVVKDVNFTGMYEVSNKGRIRSLDRLITDTLGRKHFYNGKILTPNKNNKGYLSVFLNANGVWRNVFIHRVAAEAFIPNPNNLPCVNHKDENPLNNCIENLEWCSHQYNSTYGTVRERIAATLKEFNSYKDPPLMKLDFKGNIINVYYSTDSFKFDNPNVPIDTIKNSIKYGECISNGAFWIRLDEYNQMSQKELVKLITSKIQKTNPTPIVQLDSEGNLIKQWCSIAEAKKEEFPNADISACICKRQKTAGGFKWMRLFEYTELNK